jgi:hypothetical protein
MPERRSNSELAGTMCVEKSHNKPCKQFARYAVGDGLSTFPNGYCGTHLGEGIRHVWRDKKSGAVVQEIPGMWRV